MSNLQFSPVKDLNGALEVAFVRNSGAEFLTGNQGLISIDQQRDWFFNTYVPANRERELFLYTLKEDHATIGYGLIARKDGAYWLTGVLTPENRGKGYGRLLFEFLRDEGRQLGKVKLDVLNSNKVAYDLYLKLGFSVIKKNKTKSVMELKK